MSEAPDVAVVAGFGSGKTFITCLKILTTMLDNVGCNVLYTAPTHALIRDIFYNDMGELLESYNIAYKVNREEHIVYVGGLGKVICKSMERPELIIGFKCIAAFLDEFDVPSISRQKQTYIKVKARIRQARKDGKKPQICISTTPEGFKYTYTHFKKSPIPGSELYKMSTLDNKDNLPDGYIQSLYDMYPDQLIAAYINGEFVNLVSGSAFPNFSMDRNACPTRAEKQEPIYVGQDFNIGHMASVIYVKRKENGVDQLHGVGEFIDSFDTEQTIELIKEHYPKNRTIVVPDASGNSRKSSGGSVTDFTLLRGAGFTIDAPNANPAIKDRLISAKTSFQNSKGTVRVKYNPDQCPETVDGLTQITLDKYGQLDKTMGLDHRVDAATYPIDRYFPVRRTNAAAVQIVGGY